MRKRKRRKKRKKRKKKDKKRKEERKEKDSFMIFTNKLIDDQISLIIPYEFNNY